MKNKTCLIVWSLCVCSLFANAQAMDNTLSFKNINSDSYYRLNYENDFFSGTDIYYTQGIHMELVARCRSKNSRSVSCCSAPAHGIPGMALAWSTMAIRLLISAPASSFMATVHLLLAFFLKTFQISTDTVQKTTFLHSREHRRYRPRSRRHGDADRHTPLAT